MKHIKRLFSTLLVLALALTFAVPAFATKVTMNDSSKNKNSTYTAYQLFTATHIRTDTVQNEDGSQKTVEVYNYQLNPTYVGAIKAGIDAVAAAVETKPYEGPTIQQNAEKGIDPEVNAAVLEYLSGMSSEETRIFADAVFGVVKTMDPDETAVKGVFENLNGYYLIAEEVSAEGEENAMTSLVMLRTAGNGDTLNVATKEDVPSIEKKVKDINDSDNNGETDWQDGADYDIDDYVPFQLTATLKVKGYSEFDEYYVEINDTLSDGLTFTEENGHDMKIAIDGKEYTRAELVAAGATVETSDHSVVIKFDNLKDASLDPAPNPEISEDGTGGCVIIVTYYAQLNDHAVIGSEGNPNTVHLEYSNNPYGEGTGKTPEDKVKVFTYGVEVKKVDGNNDPLPGAEFTLYKKSMTEPTEGTYEPVNKDNLSEGYWVEVGAMTKDTAGTVFSHSGIDDGEYMIRETKTPDGYNTAADLTFTVTGGHDEDNVDDPQMGTVTFSAPMTPKKDADGVDVSGVFTTDIMNLTGAELPSTGGMGTTLFYIVGGILVAAAVILLVTKKRVNSDK